MLGDGRRNLFLSVVSYQMVLNQWVDHEYWLQMMNILSLLSLGENVHLWAGISLSNLRELSLNVIGEASEFFDVH